MSNNLSNIFDKHPCPDKETLFAYLEDRLGREQTFVVESHLLDCSFCSDAMEAYREEKDLGGIQERLKELEKEIRFHEPKSGRGLGIIRRPYIKYAAVMALLLVSSFSLYLILRNNKKTADLVMEAPVSKNAPSILREEKQMPGIPEPARALNPEPAVGELTVAGVETDQSLSAEPTLVVPESGRVVKTNDLQNKNRVLSKEETDSPAGSEQKLALTISDEQKETSDVVSNVQTTNTEIAGTAGKASKKSKADDMLDSAIQYYEQGYYIYAIGMLSTFQSENRKDQAKAQWYLANAFVQTKEYEKARPVLKELGSGNSSFARKARRLLQSLE